MAGFAVIFVFVFYLIIYTETFLMNENLGGHSEYISLGNYTIYLFPSIFFIVFKLLSEKDLSLESLYTKVKSGSLIEVEILVALAFVLFIVPIAYFKGFQLYLAYILIMSQLHIFDLKTIDNG